MDEQQLSGDYGQVMGEAGKNGMETATQLDMSTALQSATLSEEVLAEIVAEAGPVPELEQYVARPTPALLVVLTGPSGVGKDVTIEKMREMGVRFHYAVTVTTRKQRPGEEDGVHYHFVSHEEYKRMLENDELLEHAEIYGNYYGTPSREVVDPLRRGEDVIMKLDVQGARTIREREPGAVSIFLAPPSMDEQIRRLFYRKTEDPQELLARLKVAGQEMHELTHFDYLVINYNNRLDETVHTIQAILLAEKCRVHPRKVQLAE